MKKSLTLIIKIAALLAIIGIFIALYRQQIYEIKLRDGMILTVFRDDLQQAVDSYYDSQLGVAVANYTGDIISLTHTSHGYYIKFRIYPYVGPHNTVGTDEIGYFVSNSGNITLKDYVHIKDYDSSKR
jgi:hypothetical protein